MNKKQHLKFLDIDTTETDAIIKISARLRKKKGKSHLLDGFKGVCNLLSSLANNLKQPSKTKSDITIKNVNELYEDALKNPRDWKVKLKDVKKWEEL